MDREFAGGSSAVVSSPRTGRGEETLASALAAHEARLSHCVHCGFCLPACPTYVRLSDEADSPRGRLHLMRAVAEGRLDPGADAFQTHIDRCLGCRACETVCPSGVEYGFLLERAREVAVGARPGGIAPRVLLAMVGSRALLGIWMGVGRALRWTRVPELIARYGPSWRWFRGQRLAMAMLAASSRWKRPTVGSTSRVLEGEEGGGSASAGIERRRGRVSVLSGCVQQHLFRRVNEATVRVLEANGWEVVSVEGQGCCGALHAHAGDLSQSREMAMRNVRAFRQAGVDWIVVNAAGCGATMREYHELFEETRRQDRRHPSNEPELKPTTDAHWFSERVRDISEVLRAPEGGSLRTGGPLPIRVAYDPPCHLLHGQRVSAPPLDLLRSIPGADVVSVPRGEECCGGAGIYGITHADLGGRIGEDKVEAVLETGAEVVATGNPGCAMQIGAGLVMRGSAVQVAHPVELLDESYRRGGLYDARS